MLSIILILIGIVLITISVKSLAKWLVEKHTIETIGYLAVILGIGLLMTLKWIIYQNHNKVYLTYLLIGMILGVIIGMVPKSTSVLIYKKEHWFMHAVFMYFALIIYAFASLFYCIEIITPGSFTGYTPWNNFFEGIIEFVYFSTVTFSTVGFGDIHPTSSVAKLAVCAEIMITFRTITLGASFATKNDSIKEK